MHAAAAGGREKGRQLQLCVMGDGGVGKSALTVQFVSNRFVSDYDPTIEESYRKVFDVDDETLMLEILDTAGQEEFAGTLSEQWISESEGFLFVYSISSAASFEALQKHVAQAKRVKGDDGLILLFVGNKCDLVDEREVTLEQAQQMAEECGYEVMETSARDRVNVDECFRTLAQLVLARRPRKRFNGNGDKRRNPFAKLCTIL